MPGPRPSRKINFAEKLRERDDGRKQPGGVKTPPYKQGRGRTCAARNLTAKAILPESRGPDVPGSYKYCDFVWNFFGSFFAKKEQTPVKNPNPASAPR